MSLDFSTEINPLNKKEQENKILILNIKEGNILRIGDINIEFTNLKEFVTFFTSEFWNTSAITRSFINSLYYRIIENDSLAGTGVINFGTSIGSDQKITADSKWMIETISWENIASSEKGLLKFTIIKVSDKKNNIFDNVRFIFDVETDIFVKLYSNYITINKNQRENLNKNVTPSIIKEKINQKQISKEGLLKLSTEYCEGENEIWKIA